MKISGNTILVTGGASGIGLALASALKSEGNEVIVAGRSPSKLEVARLKGLKTITVDLIETASLDEFVRRLLAEHPALNVVIHNAGIMRNEKMTTGDRSRTALETIATNLTAPIVLTNLMLPHLLQKAAATVMTVTSGLAFVPLAMTPTYGATKAGIHSFTESLRYQLAGTSVEVKELIPPYVRTSLMGDRQARDPNAMDLDQFISEVIAQLKGDPSAREIAVSRVLPQRTAAFGGAEKYKEAFEGQNERLFAARKGEWDAEPENSSRT